MQRMKGENEQEGDMFFYEIIEQLSGTGVAKQRSKKTTTFSIDGCTYDSAGGSFERATGVKGQDILLDLHYRETTALRRKE